MKTKAKDRDLRNGGHYQNRETLKFYICFMDRNGDKYLICQETGQSFSSGVLGENPLRILNPYTVDCDPSLRYMRPVPADGPLQIGDIRIGFEYFDAYGTIDTDGNRRTVFHAISKEDLESPGWTAFRCKNGRLPEDMGFWLRPVPNS